MDARRNRDLPTGLYEFTAAGMNILVESCAVGIEEILEKINEYGRPVVLLQGTALPVSRAIIEEKCTVSLTAMRRHI